MTNFFLGGGGKFFNSLYNVNGSVYKVLTTERSRVAIKEFITLWSKS